MHAHQDYYAPDFKLHVPVSNMENSNVREEMEKAKQAAFDALAHIESAPSVGMVTGNSGLRSTPAQWKTESDDSDSDDADARPWRRRRSHLAEFCDDDDNEGDRMHTDTLGLADFEDCGCQFGCSDCDGGTKGSPWPGTPKRRPVVGM